MTNPPNAPIPVTPSGLAEMKQRGDRIVMVTAYDAPSARLADEVGIDLILVGDSAGKKVLGHETTLPVTMHEMIVLTAAVCRAARRALVVADLPFGSYQVSDEEAVANAIRFVKEGRASAVKLEGAGPMLSRVRAIVDSGIPVMGHIGYTPQSGTAHGGMEVQGATAATARRIFADAVDLEQAGCFATVLELMPGRVAARITQELRIPTIGIGAGPGCDGQVLVWHDLLGISEGPVPHFVKRYADVAGEIRRGLRGFATGVRSRAYPDEEHSYEISDAEWEAFGADLLPPVPAE